MAENHGKGVLYCGGISEEEGHTQCPYCLVDRTGDLAGRKYIKTDARLRDFVQVLRCRDADCAGCDRCQAAHGRRATDEQERRQNRIDTFGASEGLDGDPGWPEPAAVPDHVRQPENWLVVARRAALALHEARHRARTEYDAELARLTKVADAREAQDDGPDAGKDYVLPADQLGRLHLSEVRVPEGIVDRCWCCEAAIVAAGLCERCAELSLEPTPESDEPDVETPGSETEAEKPAEVDARELRRQRRAETAAGGDEEHPVEQHTGRGRGRGGRGRGRWGSRGGRAGGNQARGRGSGLGGTRQEYADDIIAGEVTTEPGSEDALLACAAEMTRRATAIAVISRVRLGLRMACPKCKVLWIQPAELVGPTTPDDVRALGLDHICECGKPFACGHGMSVHRRKCIDANDYMELAEDDSENHKIEALLEVRGPPNRRFWRVKWYGVNEDGTEKWPDKGTGTGLKARTHGYDWQEEKMLDGEETRLLIQKFWRMHPELDKDVDNQEHYADVYRCTWCNRIYKTEASWAGHKLKCPVHRKILTSQTFKGGKADKLVQKAKRQLLLARLPDVLMEHVKLQKVLSAEYLGHIFQSDGGCEEDVTSRMLKARQRFNKLNWLWDDSDLGKELKMRIFLRGVISILTYGSEAWHLNKKIMRKLNGWCSRCLTKITGQSCHAEASIKTRTMWIGGILQYRRKVWLGHILRSSPEDLCRQDVLRTAELERLGVMSGDGSILMDAPSSSNKRLIQMAGGSGTEEEREVARVLWKASCIQLLSEADRKRMGKTTEAHVVVKANTKEETAAELAAKPHRWRIYTDGGCDESGKGEESGAAGWGVYIVEVDAESGELTLKAHLWGPVVTDVKSKWWMGAARGTNQTGELNGIGQALMWLRDVAGGDDPAAIVYDSMYAANMTQGNFEPNCNKEAVALNVKLLAEQGAVRTVHFVHVKGHSGDEGNDAADERVQWGKDVNSPMCRLREGGGEGQGRFEPCARVPRDDILPGGSPGGAGGGGVDGLASPATPASSALPASPATPSLSASPAAPATPVMPASPASPATDALEDAWEAQRREGADAELAELEEEEQREQRWLMPPPPPRGRSTAAAAGGVRTTAAPAAGAAANSPRLVGATADVGEEDGEELGGVAAAGGIDTAAELATEGAVQPPGPVEATENEGDMQLAPVDGPRSLAEVFARISAEVCESVGGKSITPQSGRIMNT